MSNEAAERLREPQTKAGRALLAYFPEIVEFATVESILGGILAIETEAGALGAQHGFREGASQVATEIRDDRASALAHERSAGAARLPWVEVIDKKAGIAIEVEALAEKEAA